ncbi:MAG: pilus assembly protein [Mesorhizobium sp.]|nr:MAG: pilus assembly protein [Mesorhizobium sp.]RWB97973.1 MAG: pilus assembly protein [Mesorhizobium sp.]
MLKHRKFLAPWSRLRTDVAGTSAVEFAMLVPIFILLLLGMVAYGIYFGASHSVQQIAADAARKAIAGLDQTERQALVTDFISHDVSDAEIADVKASRSARCPCRRLQSRTIP